MRRCGKETRNKSIGATASRIRLESAHCMGGNRRVAAQQLVDSDCAPRGIPMRAHEARIYFWIDRLLIGRCEKSLRRIHRKWVLRDREISDPVARRQRSVANHIASSIAGTHRVMARRSNRDIPTVIGNQTVLCRRDERAHRPEPLVSVSRVTHLQEIVGLR